MKKHSVIRFITACMVVLAFSSCDKKENTRERMIKGFLNQYESGKTNILNSSLQVVKAEQTAPNEITLDVTSELSGDAIQPALIKAAVSDLMVAIIRKNPRHIQLLNKGVNFKVNLTGKNGEKIGTQIINKSSMTAQKPDFSQNEKHAKLNQLLEVSNSNLPVTDSASGVKITKVFVGSENDVIYTAEVPEAMKSIIKMPENKNIIKKNMSKDKEFRKMVMQLKEFDISKVKYQYRDRNGKLLQEVAVTADDFR